MSRYPEVITNINPLPDRPLSLSIKKPEPNLVTSEFVRLMLQNTTGIDSQTVTGGNGSFKFEPANKLFSKADLRYSTDCLVTAALRRGLDREFQLGKGRWPSDYPKNKTMRSLMAQVLHGLDEDGFWSGWGPLQVEPLKNKRGSRNMGFATNYKFTTYDQPDLQTSLESGNDFVDHVALDAGGHNLLIAISSAVKRRHLEELKAGVVEQFRGRIAAVVGVAAVDLSFPGQSASEVSWYNEPESLD